MSETTGMKPKNDGIHGAGSGISHGHGDGISTEGMGAMSTEEGISTDESISTEGI